MALDNDPRPVLRQELARVFKNQRVIRAFEKIFDLIPPEFLNQQEQIDLINVELAAIEGELGQQNVSDLREQVEALRQQLQGALQNPSL